MNLNDKVEKFRKVFELHMVYEYPQIDADTRKFLAWELAIVAAAV